MRTIVSVIGVLLVLGGLVWVAQGLNLPFAPRSWATACSVVQPFVSSFSIRAMTSPRRNPVE